MTMPELRRITRWIHNRHLRLGWDNPDSMRPALYWLAARRGGGTLATRVPIGPRTIWSNQDLGIAPADVINAIPMFADQPRHIIGLVLTLEAWTLGRQVIADTTPEQWREIRERRVYLRDDKQSCRTTIGLDVDDREIHLNQVKDDPTVEEQNTDDNETDLAMARGHGTVIRSLIHYLGRLTADTV